MISIRISRCRSDWIFDRPQRDTRFLHSRQDWMACSDALWVRPSRTFILILSSLFSNVPNDQVSLSDSWHLLAYVPCHLQPLISIICCVAQMVNVNIAAVIARPCSRSSCLQGDLLSTRPHSFDGKRSRREKKKHVQWSLLACIRIYIWSRRWAWVWSLHLDSIAPWKMCHRETLPSSVSWLTSSVIQYC